MKILLWQTAFLGDLILTTPLIASIKALYPDSHLTVVAKPFGKDVLKNNPYVDELIVFDKKKHSTFSLIKDLRKKKFDLAISPHRSHRASYSLFFAKIPERIGFDRAGFSFLYTKRAKHTFDGIHEIDRNFRLLELLPEYDEKKLIKYPQIFLDEKEDEFYKTLGLKNKDYIVVAPGSKWETKKWTEEGFNQVIKQLSRDTKVVVIGGKEDLATCEKVLQGLSSKNVMNLAG